MDSVKSQSSALMVVFVVVFFLMIVVFLFSFITPADRGEYMNLYVHNLLQSVMRSDTGYMDRNCKLLSDTIACAFTEPSSYRCGSSGPTCISLADETISRYMGEFETIKKNYRYLFIVKPEGFVTRAGLQEVELKFGDETIEKVKGDRFVSDQKIQKIVGGEPLILNIKLIVSKRD
jgi:hypothetical protein